MSSGGAPNSKESTVAALPNPDAALKSDMTHALAAAVEMRKGATDAVEASQQLTLALMSKWRKEQLPLTSDWRWRDGERRLFAKDIPEERIPSPERTRFRAGFHYPFRHHRTNYIMRPVRIRRGLPQYFCDEWLTREYCEYHHLRLCEMDQHFKKHGIKRRPDGQLYSEDQPPQQPPGTLKRKANEFFKKYGIKRRPDEQFYTKDQPPPPPPEADWDKLTALDVIAYSAPRSPPSPQALEFDVILDTDGE